MLDPLFKWFGNNHRAIANQGSICWVVHFALTLSRAERMHAPLFKPDHIPVALRVGLPAAVGLTGGRGRAVCASFGWLCAAAL